MPIVKPSAAVVARFIAEDGHAQLVLYDDGALMLEVPYKDPVQIAKWHVQHTAPIDEPTLHVPSLVLWQGAQPTKETR